MSAKESKPLSCSPPPPNCCILHHLYYSAFKNPNKTAVIHAHADAQQLLPVSTNPPLYQGDECFTFAQIVAAVDTLSCRIRNLLGGAHDPGLIIPTLGILISFVCQILCYMISCANLV